MTFEQIQDVIRGLGRERQKELLRWLSDWDDWDQQMYEDIKAGRLNPLLEEVDRDIKEGNLLPMPTMDDVNQDQATEASQQSETEPES